MLSRWTSGFIALLFTTLATFLLSQTVIAQTSTSASTQGEATAKAGIQAPTNSAASASVADDDNDNPDIPSIARRLVSETEYLQLRDKHIGMLRGLKDLARNPQARSQAIGKMEAQEQMLKRMNPASLSTAVGIPSAPLLPSTPTWFPIGPDPIPNGQTIVQDVPVSGRVTAIAIDPTDSSGDTIYVGTGQGGLYRSLDGGSTWTALMDSAKSLVIGAITIDPNNHTTLFVGTGEGNFALDTFFGVGLYIIQNATTTADLSGPFNAPTVSPNPDGFTDVFTGRSITKILVNPANSNQILVSTASGVSGASGDVFIVSALPTRGAYLSTNALSGSPTFARLNIQSATDKNRPVTDMVLDPANPNAVVVNVFGLTDTEGGVWMSSTNPSPWSGNATWTQTLQTAVQGNGKFAVSPATNPSTFLLTLDQTASTAPCNGQHGTLRVSMNGGSTWAELTAARGFCGKQCFYDLPVAVDPTNASNIFIGGQAGNSIGSCGAGTLGKSTNGGSTFASSQNSLHADSHSIAILSSNPLIMYTGNDGGIFRSNDGGVTWISRNTVGFNATQFESVAVHPSDPDFTIGGTQDNGTPFLQPSGEWMRADSGDGGFSAIDQNATDTVNVTMYHTYFNLSNTFLGYAQVTGTANAFDGGWTFSGCQNPPTAGNGITCSDKVLFYPPLTLGPGSPNAVYFGTDRLYRSTNNGTTNTVVSQAPLVANVPISAIGISPQDDNFRLVGLGEDDTTGVPNGHVFLTTTGSSTLTDVTGGWATMYIARAVIDPTNKNTAYVTLDGYGTTSHVWKTTTLNVAPPTWTAASGSGTASIPDVPVNALVVDPVQPLNLYVGTDIGVFNSTDGGSTWNPYGTGLPRVAVFDMKLTARHTIRIATHGRGMWETAAIGINDDTTSLAPNPSHISPGGNVTLTATVNHGISTMPTGTVTFFDGTTALASPALDATGVATFSTTAFASGLHNLTGVYGGDATFRSSVSTPVQVGVGPLVTGMSLFAGPTTPAVGATVTFTANIDTGSSQALPTGNVSFMEGSTTLGTTALSGSVVARFQTSSLSQGSHSVIAQYSGDTVYSVSNSAPIVINVGLTPDYSISIPTGSATVHAGTPATYAINLTPSNGFTGNVNFACTSGVPSLAACSFTPATVNLNGSSQGSTTLTITTTAPTAALPASNLGARLATGGGLLGLLLMFGIATKEARRRTLFMMLGVFSLTMTLISCGGGSSTPHNPGTPAGTFTVTLSATSGSTAHTSTITLTVQ